MKFRNRILLLSLAILFVLGCLFWQGKRTTTSAGGRNDSPVAGISSASSSSDSTYQKMLESRQQRRIKRHLLDEEALALGLPRGTFEYVFDKAPGANKFLLAKGRDSKYVPDSDAASGMDMWLQDETGKEHLIDSSVSRAKFSPDSSKIAFTTSDAVLHVQDVNGGKVAEVPGVYGPSWSPDGSAVIFSKVGEGQDPRKPGTRQLTTLDVATGQIKPLTDGNFDDGRPEFNPANNSIVFVSGARSGLASFWQVPLGGGEPVQLTNVGLDHVNERFVPTPYDKTIWSGNKRWFLYDYKNGEQQETWGLEFNPDGSMRQATKLAEGINPRWKEDGKIFVCEKISDGKIETIIANLP